VCGTRRIGIFVQAGEQAPREEKLLLGGKQKHGERRGDPRGGCVNTARGIGGGTSRETRRGGV